MVIQMQFSDDDGRLGATVPRRPALQGAEVSAGGGTDVGRWPLQAAVILLLSHILSLSCEAC